MKRLKPETLIGPRSYFTDFDHRIVARTNNIELLRRHTERKLKLLLLIKSKIVCAASHIVTDFAYSIFRKNPALLNEGHIIPALRNDKQSFSELLEKKETKNKKQIIEFYNQNVIVTVGWDLEKNSKWFRDKFIEELENPHSLIRIQLNKASTSVLPAQFIEDLKRDVQETEIISRSLIEHHVKGLSQQQQDLILNFRELVYHISGARVVNSESALPQENYIDYDLADLTQRRTKLSDDQILFKLFLELAFESFQKRLIPIEILDLLDFSDILTIRQPILNSDFQQKYNKIIEQIVHANKNDYKQIFFNLNELEKIRSDLEKTFNEIFESELPLIKKKILKSHIKQVASIGSSVGLGLLSFLPLAGTAASGLSLLKDTPAFIFNLRQLFLAHRSLKNTESMLNQRRQYINKLIRKSDLSDKTIMLDMVDMLTRLISEKTKLI